MIDFLTSEDLVKYFAVGWWYHSTDIVGEVGGGGTLIRRWTLCRDELNQKKKILLTLALQYNNKEQKNWPQSLCTVYSTTLMPVCRQNGKAQWTVSDEWHRKNRKEDVSIYVNYFTKFCLDKLRNLQDS